MQKSIFYRTQIEGFSEVADTVRVIEKSAASHIHFLKKKVQALAEYKRQIKSALGRLARFYWDDNHPLLQERISGKAALLAITGERGIVGGLYHELVNEAVAKSDNYEYIWVIGKKGVEYFNEEGIWAEEFFMRFGIDDLPGSEDARKISELLFERFQGLKLKRIDVLYAGFASLAEQKPTIVQFLPFKIKDEGFDAAADSSADGFPIFEPSKRFIFDELFRRYIDVFFEEIILEAKFSELAARTVTAESAVKETERLIKQFSHEFLKAKHLSIIQKQVESFSVHKLTRV